ncbi:MAG: hypothetical protein HZB70_01920 [Candidatus Berkelbacteria bacterium]|nr:MAG: hypothetical protein HZB70_01920 [Candidatus Berkelbacteria bacterium]QQG51920.1 MAG: hypothetical protein HY845_01075 [Candidatus Berkelbacteria bacterium]
MSARHKERRWLLLYAFVFFVTLAIGAYALLIQLQNSGIGAAEFFEPITIDLSQPLF